MQNDEPTNTPTSRQSSRVRAQGTAPQSDLYAEEAKRFRLYLDSQTDAICCRDQSGAVTFANETYWQLFSREGDHGPMTNVESEVSHVSSTGQGPLSISEPIQIQTKDGPRWFVWERRQLPQGEGTAPEFMEIGRDITTYWTRETETARARDNARAADQAKSRLLAAVSHEIRTPMNGILGMTDLLMGTDQTPEQDNYCQAIDNSARSLLSLIDELLDLSKIEAGKVTLRDDPLDLQVCVQHVVELLATRAHKKGLELAWTIDKRLTVPLVGDEVRLRQILLNLISNAIKFTETGGVLVSCEMKSCEGSIIRIQIQVQDTGVGISPEFLNNIFAEYEREQNLSNDEQSGSGLGLAISHKLARAMNGDIRVESPPGGGATFTAEVELELLPDGASLDKEPEALDDLARHVLIVSNRSIERLALARTLRGHGVKVQEMALPRARLKSSATYGIVSGIDAIVVDGDCAVDVARDLLAAAREAADGDTMRGVVMTSATQRDGIGKFRGAGFNAYLIRPVRPMALLRQLGAAQGPTDGTSPSTSRQTQLDPLSAVGDRNATPVLQGLHVLLVEDNDINALLSRRLLENMGCSLVHVKDGQMAVEAVRETVSEQARWFDLILMDLHLPVLDGYAATDQIRSLIATADRINEDSKMPPIIAVTANAFEEDRRQALAAGMDGYLAKPFERVELEAIMRTLVSSGGDDQNAIPD